MAGVDATHIRKFWDERAREDAYFFVDNRRQYGDPDVGPFWADGVRDLDTLLEALDVRIEPTNVVLDLGCGVGRLTRVIAERAARVCGVDVSSEMVALARQHNAGLNNVEWIVGNGSDLEPLPDQSFDLCLSHVVFQHIPDPAITLGYVREMGRVLRAGGLAAFQISNDPGVHARQRERRLRLPGRRGPSGQRDSAWLGSAIDLGQLHVAAVEGGLELERIVGQSTQFCLVRARKG